MLLFILIFLNTLYSSCNSEKDSKVVKRQYINEIDEYSKSDTLESSKLSLNGLKIGDSKEDLLKKIGRPQKIEKGYNEFQNSESQIYYYFHSKLYVEDGKLEGFEVNDKKLTLDSLNIRIGQNFEDIKVVFPYSYDMAIKSGNSSSINVFVRDLDQHFVLEFHDGKLSRFLLIGGG